MIPYDDLVIALATWRARQGLPVAQLSGALTPPPPPPERPASTPPPPPPGGGWAANTPPPLAPAEPQDEPIAVDDAALLEEAQYDNDGADFAMAFDQLQHDAGEATAIGVPPPARDSFGAPTDPEPDVPGDKRGGGSGW